MHREASKLLRDGTGSEKMTLVFESPGFCLILRVYNIAPQF
jgi:hypothetical protein